MIEQSRDLPHLSDRVFLSDGGLETTLVFHDGMELPHFAAIDLLKDEAGCRRLRDYFIPYLELARQKRLGFILESATWRAGADWAEPLGYSAEQLVALNHRAIAVLLELRDEYETADSPLAVSGCIGPRDDGYFPAEAMDPAEAEAYHLAQIEELRDAGADMVSAFTMTYAEEAIGITRAARRAAIPVVISFTLETDGRLPSGESLGDAIARVDGETDGGPDYYMINCAHPSHFEHVLRTGEPWLRRIRGIRANASCKSHAELDESETLDVGNPGELGGQYRALRNMMPNLKVLGGCCGTDYRHVEAICMACA